MPVGQPSLGSAAGHSGGIQAKPQGLATGCSWQEQGPGLPAAGACPVLESQPAGHTAVKDCRARHDVLPRFSC